ncbi:hypothetical protein [Aliikangiella sp. IMCC44359]|uniref:hypothetical protein n=1 Tax=Aliikangiella sp. IMCC44359 TaxID=3459125 RepID=UPI00403B0D67
MNSFKALVKREYWEHKGAIFYTPAIMVAIFAGLLLVGALTGGNIQINDNDFVISNAAPEIIEQFSTRSEEKREVAMKMFLRGFAVPFGLVLLVISLFYALGSLYDERKDRSILFWKSLPISDTSTVLSKFVAIVVLAPTFYFIAITVFQLFFMLYVTVVAWFSGNSGGIFWSSTNLFAVFFDTLSSLLVASIWLAPVWAWCMLMSAWAKKVPFLWATLPLLILVIAEGWVFGSTSFVTMLGEHIAKGFAIQNSFINTLSENNIQDISVFSVSDSLSSFDFWIGLAVAAVFLVAAIYTRRYKDES